MAEIAIRQANILRSHTTETFELMYPPKKEKGIAVRMIGSVINHCICPVAALEIKAAKDDSITIAKLLPIAILVGILT